MGERVEALRLVHEQVYAARNADQLSLRPYVTELLQGLLALHREVSVRLEVQIEDVEIGSDTAIPLGLIPDEFTTNSLKYAFEGVDRRLVSPVRGKNPIGHQIAVLLFA